MNKRTKTLLFSMLALCVSTMLVVGGTYALFTDSAKVNNHLQAGNLTVGLYRTAYTENVLDSDGFLVKKDVQLQNNVIDDDDMNLHDSDEEWLFVMNNAVPQSYCEATLDVFNNGTVAFDYGMSLVVTEGADTNLAEQIEIKVTYGDSEKSFMLSDYASNNIEFGALTAGKSGRFTVKATFIDNDDVNNDAMDESVKFYIQVSATQKTTRN